MTVALNDAAQAALEWREITRRQRAAHLATTDYFQERLPAILEFFMNVVESNHPSVLTPTVVRGRGEEGDTIVDIPPTIKDRIRASQEIMRLLGLTRDTTRVQIAVGAVPQNPDSGRLFDEEVRDPVQLVIDALRLSTYDGGDNARLAVLMERLAADERRQLAAVPGSPNGEPLEASVLETSSNDPSVEPEVEQPPTPDDPPETASTGPDEDDPPASEPPPAPPPPVWRPPDF